MEAKTLAIELAKQVRTWFKEEGAFIGHPVDVAIEAIDWKRADIAPHANDDAWQSELTAALRTELADLIAAVTRVRRTHIVTGVSYSTRDGLRIRGSDGTSIHMTGLALAAFVKHTDHCIPKVGDDLQAIDAWHCQWSEDQIRAPTRREYTEARTGIRGNGREYAYRWMREPVRAIMKALDAQKFDGLKLRAYIKKEFGTDGIAQDMRYCRNKRMGV